MKPPPGMEIELYRPAPGQLEAPGVVKIDPDALSRAVSMIADGFAESITQMMNGLADAFAEWTRLIGEVLASMTPALRRLSKMSRRRLKRRLAKMQDIAEHRERVAARIPEWKLDPAYRPLAPKFRRAHRRRRR